LVVVNRLVIVEITPTEARGTGTGLRSLAFSIGITIGLFLGSIITYNFGLAWTFIIFSILPLFINIPLNYFLLKETKDVDLQNLFKP
jgi:MFS family permease